MSTTSLGGSGLTIHPDEKIYAGPVTVDTSQGITVGSMTVPFSVGDVTVPGTVPSLPGGGSLPVDPTAVLGTVSSLPGSAMTTLNGLLNNLSQAPSDIASSLGQAVSDQHYNITPASVHYSVAATGAHLEISNVFHPIVVDFKTP